MKETLLKVGDVFELTKGMECYSKIPAKFVYSNTPFSNELTEALLRIGDVLTCGELSRKAVVKSLIKHARDYSDFQGVKFDEDKMEAAIILPERKDSRLDTNDYLGEYVVVETKSQGGGTGMGPHDVYYDGWFIVARRLNRGKYDDKGKKITFYQTGSFTAMNPKVPVIRTLKMSFK